MMAGPAARSPALTRQKHAVLLLCFLATCTAYVERTGFSVAYTAMCNEGGASERVKGIVMSAFYWGYGGSQIPGGILAQRFGGRRMLLVCFAGWATCALLTPPKADAAVFMAVVRVLVGVFQGLLIPAVHTVLSQWALPHERAKATSLCTSGMYLGSACAIECLPYLAHVTAHPPIIFRLVAASGYAWLALWAIYGRDVKHRAALIPVTAQDAAPVDGAKAADSKGLAPTPWLRLLTHRAVWAIVMNNFTFHYAFYMVMNWLPTYFAGLIGTDLAAVGFGKAIPYLVMFVTSNLGGWAGDWLIDAGCTVAMSRKAVNSVGFCATAVLLLAMPYAATVPQGLLTLSLCLGACGFSRGGFSVNHMDVAPQYAGVVMGVSNTAGTLSGIVGVSTTGFLLEAAGGSSARTGWVHAHLVAAAMGLAGSLFFILYGRGSRLVT